MGQVSDTKFGTNVCNEMLLNAAKYQGYSFYHFGVIKGKTTGLRGAGAGAGEGSKYTPNTLAFFFKKLKIL